MMIVRTVRTPYGTIASTFFPKKSKKEKTKRNETKKSEESKKDKHAAITLVKLKFLFVITLPLSEILFQKLP